MGAATAGLACCCCGGAIALVRRYLQADRRAQQRYQALATTDAVESDDDDDEYLDVDGAGAEAEDAGGRGEHGSEDTAAAKVDEDLLDFSLNPPASTPPGFPAHAAGVTPAAMSATSASWVDEMNAELAEFDALTSQVSGGEMSTPTSNWESGLEAELQQKLVTPHR
jgi:hypothetical protein